MCRNRLLFRPFDRNPPFNPRRGLQSVSVCAAARIIPGFGAGDGNRTRVASLEGWSSTIELHPPGSAPLHFRRGTLALASERRVGLGGRGRIRTYVGRSQRVYSPSPLATRAPFRSADSTPRRRRGLSAFTVCCQLENTRKTPNRADLNFRPGGSCCKA
jgi:hypothetical protein